MNQFASDRPCSFNECVSIFRWQFAFSPEKTNFLIFIISVQESVEGAATAAALKSWSLSSKASSDVLRFGENRDRIRTLEQDVMFWKGQLAVARSKEKSAIDAEVFILECLDATNQELASKISFSFFYLPVLVVETTLILWLLPRSFCAKSSRRRETCK